MSTPLPTLALFGATGGCINVLLKHALSTGHHVTCLARTPGKLAALTATYPNLTIVPGDVHDLATVRETLIQNGRVVDIVASGIGMVPHRKGFSIDFGDRHICEEGTRTILNAIGEIEKEGKVQMVKGGPRVVVLSTTGISSHGRDIPIAMVPLYHWLLSIPHEDKRKMEELVVNSGRRFTIVRPSFLNDGKAKGKENVRVGVEGGESQIGYTICREDVGGWVFGECVKGDGKKWEGKVVSLTH